MSAKIVWLRVSLGLLVVLGGGAWALSSWYLNSYTNDVSDRLELLVELRKGAVEQYFSTAEAELTFWSTSEDILAAQTAFNSVWEGEGEASITDEIQSNYRLNNPNGDDLSLLNDAGDGSPYSQVHSSLHPLTKLFVSERGYYDAFLIGKNGRVYYTVEKESDFGDNLLTGPLRDSNLGEVFRLALSEDHGGVVFSDLRAYGPSNGAPAIFMAKSLVAQDGEIIGVIAFQLPTSKITQIMHYGEGMGESGETYLVGQDMLMRSNSRFSDSPTILLQAVKSTGVNKALAGNSGVEFINDYRGVEVLSAYTSLNVGENTWAVMAKFDREEIVSASAEAQPSLKGSLLFIYGLSIWSFWYWRGGSLDTIASVGVDSGLDLQLAEFGNATDVGS